MAADSDGAEHQERVCVKCKNKHPNDMFCKGSPYCRECRRTNSRRYNLKRRQKLLKSDVSTMICRTCSRCLPASSFAFGTRRCRTCDSEYRKERHRRRKRTLEVATQATCGVCKESKPASEFYINYSSRGGLSASCKRCAAIYFRTRLYGVTRDEIKTLLQAQSCEICQKPFVKDSDKLIDHDHKSGEIRGVLCTYCNSIIGYCDESADTLALAIRYLNERKRPQSPES
jgi:hypothetical protein